MSYYFGVLHESFVLILCIYDFFYIYSKLHVLKINTTDICQVCDPPCVVRGWSGLDKGGESHRRGRSARCCSQTR